MAAAAAGMMLLGPAAYAANTADIVKTGGTTTASGNEDLSVGANYTTTITPTTATTIDIEFGAAVSYSPATFDTNGAALKFGTLDDLNNSQITITNTSATAGSITLSTAANSLSGTAADLLFVKSGSSLSLQNTTGSAALTLALGVSGNIDDAGTLSLTNALSLSTFTATFTGSGTTTLGGVVSGSGGVVIQDAGGSVTLFGADTYTGVTTVNSGILQLDFTQGGAPASNIINSAANSSALTMAGGLLNIIYANGTTTTQRFNGTTVSGGYSLFQVNTNGNSIATSGITLGALTRSGTGTIDFTLPTSGAGITTTSTTFVSNGVLVNAATNGVAYASANGGATWATNTAGTLGALSTYSTGAGSYVAGNNIDVTDGDAPASGFTVNTLRFNTSATLTTAGTNTISTGGILVTPNGNVATLGTAGSAINAGGGKELVFLDDGVLNVAANIVDSASGASALTLGGTGTTVLSGTDIYTGATNIDSGTLQIGSTGALPAGTTLTFSNNSTGLLQLLGNNISIGGLSSGSPVGIPAIENGAATPATLTLTTSGAPSSAAVLRDGTGGASLALTFAGTGSQTLSGVNTYTGGTTINSGAIKAGAGTTILGTGLVTFGASNAPTLDLNGNNITTGLLAGTGTNGIVTNNSTGTATATITLSGTSSSQTFNGTIRDGSTAHVAYTQIGNGKETLTGANTFTGAVTLGNGNTNPMPTLTITNSGALGIGPKTVTATSGGVLHLQNNITLASNLSFVTSGPVITSDSGNNAILGNFTLTSGDGSTTLTSTSGTLTIGVLGSSTIADNTTSRILLFAGAGNGIINSAINDGTSPLPVQMTSPGIWVLNGVNSFTGATTVSLGTLATNNPAALGKTAITVGSGAAITGSAGDATLLVKGNTTFGFSAAGNALTISGGDGTTTGQGTLSLLDGTINTLSLGNLAAAGTALTLGGTSSGQAAVLDFEIGGSSGSSDSISLAANDALLVNTGGAIVNVTLPGTVASGTSSYNLITYASGNATLNGGFTFSNQSTTETIGNDTLTLSNTATAEVLTITNAGPAVPATAYFQGSNDNNWTTVTGGNSNFTVDHAGTTNTGSPPGSSTDVYFTTDTVPNPNYQSTVLGANFVINSLTIGTGAAAGNPVTITGSNTLTINAAADSNSTPTYAGGNPAGNGINVLAGAGAVTISAPIVLGAPQTWTNSSSNTFTVNGGITAGTDLLTFAGSGNTAVSGTAPVTTSAGFTINSGTGTVGISAPVTLGAAQTWTNNSTNTFTVSGGLTEGANLLTFAGAGNTTISSASVTASGGFIVNSGAGSETISAPITLGAAQSWTNNSTNTFTISGGVTAGSNLLTFAGTGNTTLSGTAAVVTSSGFTVAAGTGAVTISAPVTLGAAQTWTNNASNTLTVSGGVTATTNLLTLAGAGNTTISGTSAYATSSGFTVSSGGGTITVSAPVTLGASQTWTNNGTNPVIVSGVVGGSSSFTLTKGGTPGGSITLSGANTFAGPVSVVAGGLIITNSSALGTGTKTITIIPTTNPTSNPSLQLDGSGGNITLPSTLSFVTSYDALNNAVPIAGEGAIINIAGNNTIAGAFSLPSGGGGTTLLSNAGTLTFSGNFTPSTTGRAINLRGNGNGVISGIIANGSTVALPVNRDTGTGTWTLSGANTYTGPTTINAGVLNAATLANGGSNSAIGASTNAATNLVFGGGTLQYTGSTARTTDRLFTVGDTGSDNPGNTAAIDASGSATAATVTFSSTLALAFTNAVAHTLTLTGSNNGLNTLAPIIGDQSAGNSTIVIKSGVGTWALSAANTYTGPTNVNAGTLIVGLTNSGSLGASSAVSVADGAVLGGAGTVNGPVTLTSSTASAGAATSPGGAITAGTGGTAAGSVGKLTLAGASNTFGAGTTSGQQTTYDWKLASATAAAGVGYDLISVSGLSVGGSVDVVPIALSGSSATFNSSSTFTWDILGGTTSSAASVGTLASQFHLDTTQLPAFAASLGANPSSFSIINDASDGDIAIQYAPAPEPTALMLLGMGAGAMTLRRRRRRATTAAV
jgi:fibronectin-binding autotransporter adhesin